MNRRVLALTVFAWAVSLLLAFKLGLHAGPNMYANLESPARGAVLVYELTALRAGRTAEIINGKEIDLDAQVVRAMRCLRAPCEVWFWPLDFGMEKDRLLGTMANYRRQFKPAIVPDETPRAAGEFDPNPFAREVASATEELIRGYVQK
jgi:hypothetical protein